MNSEWAAVIPGNLRLVGPALCPCQWMHQAPSPGGLQTIDSSFVYLRAVPEALLSTRGSPRSAFPHILAKNMVATFLSVEPQTIIYLVLICS